MGITARRISEEIAITGASQEVVTSSVLGRIDQLIIESSVPGQSADIHLFNHQGQLIYNTNGLLIDTIVNDIRPNVLPMGPVTIRINDPVSVEGTITVTIIEKERES